MHQQETDLYRHYDIDKNLLYVGISLNTAQRLYQHMRGSKWASEIATIEVERLPSRQEALNAEEIAIKKEKPLWNVIHNRETKREKGTHKHPAQKATKKPSHPKSPNPSTSFNVESMGEAIDYTISKLRQLSMMSLAVTCTEDIGASTFVDIKIDLPDSVMDDDIELNEFMDRASFSPYSYAHVAMMTGYSRIDERDVNKSTKISLMTPGWLRRVLYGDLDLARKTDSEILARINTLIAMYESEFLGFLSMGKPSVVTHQSLAEKERTLKVA